MPVWHPLVVEVASGRGNVGRYHADLRSENEVAPIDREDGSGNERGGGRGQKHRTTRDLVRRAPAAHRCARDDGAATLVVVLEGLGQWRGNPARGDRVDADAVAGPGRGQALGQLRDAA